MKFINIPNNRPMRQYIVALPRKNNTFFYWSSFDSKAVAVFVAGDIGGVSFDQAGNRLK